MKNFCSAKDTYKKMKREDTELKNKIFSVIISDKGLVSVIYKELSKWAKEPGNGFVWSYSAEHMTPFSCHTTEWILLYVNSEKSTRMWGDRWSTDWDGWRQRNLTVLQIIHIPRWKGMEKKGDDLSNFEKHCFDWYYKAKHRENCKQTLLQLAVFFFSKACELGIVKLLPSYPRVEKIKNWNSGRESQGLTLRSFK